MASNRDSKRGGRRRRNAAKPLVVEGEAKEVKSEASSQSGTSSDRSADKPDNQRAGDATTAGGDATKPSPAAASAQKPSPEKTTEVKSTVGGATHQPDGKKTTPPSSSSATTQKPSPRATSADKTKPSNTAEPSPPAAGAKQDRPADPQPGADAASSSGGSGDDKKPSEPKQDTQPDGQKKPADTAKPATSDNRSAAPEKAGPDAKKKAAGSVPSVTAPKDQPATTSKTGANEIDKDKPADKATSEKAASTKNKSDEKSAVSKPDSTEKAAKNGDGKADPAKNGDTKSATSGDEKDAGGLPVPPAQQPQKSGPSLFWIVTSAIIGGFAALALQFALDSSGNLPFGHGKRIAEAQGEVDALKGEVAELRGEIASRTEGLDPAKVAGIETQVEALEAKIADVEADTAAPTDGDALSARLAELEQQVGAAADTDGLQGKLTELESRIASIADQDAAGGSAESASELNALAERLASAESEIADIRSAADSAAVSPPETGDTGRAADGAQAGTGDNAVNEQLATLSTRLTEIGNQITGLPDTSAFPERLEVLEKGLADLKAGLGALDGTTTRLDDIEKKTATLGALEESITSASETGSSERTALSEKIDETASSVTRVGEEFGAFKNEVSSLTGRIDQIEGSIGGPEARNAAAQALTALDLRQAVESGKPFAQEHATLAALGGNTEILEAIGKFKDSGVPTVSTIIKEFSAASQAIAASQKKPVDDDDLLGKFMNNALSTVTIKSTDGTADTGSGASAAVSAIAGALRSGDLAGAQEQWGTLPDAAKAASQGWADKLAARIEADRLLADLSADILSSLSGN